MAVRGVPVRVTVTLVGGSNSPRLDVLIDSKATVGALRAQIWKALARHGEWQPGHPRDLRMITAGRELKMAEDWRTLAEAKLREPYVLHVMRRALGPAPAPAAPAAAPAAADAPAAATRRRPPPTTR